MLSPRARMLIGMAGVLLAPCLFVSHWRADMARHDGETLGALLRMAGVYSAGLGGFLTLAFVVWVDRAVYRDRPGLSWKARRYRDYNRYCFLLVLLFYLPLVGILAMARQLYWPVGNGGWAFPLTPPWGHIISLQWTYGLLASFLVPYVFVIIRRLKARGANACDWCGYNLTGAASDRCPECGHPIVEPDAHREAGGKG